MSNVRGGRKYAKKGCQQIQNFFPKEINRNTPLMHFCIFLYLYNILQVLWMALIVCTGGRFQQIPLRSHCIFLRKHHQIVASLYGRRRRKIHLICHLLSPIAGRRKCLFLRHIDRDRYSCCSTEWIIKASAQYLVKWRRECEKQIATPSERFLLFSYFTFAHCCHTDFCNNNPKFSVSILFFCIVWQK